MPTITTAELRQKLVSGIDRILGRPFLTSSDEKLILRAVRQTYLEDDAVVNKILARVPSFLEATDEEHSTGGSVHPCQPGDPDAVSGEAPAGPDATAGASGETDL